MNKLEVRWPRCSHGDSPADSNTRTDCQSATGGPSERISDFQLYIKAIILTSQPLLQVWPICALIVYRAVQDDMFAAALGSRYGSTASLHDVDAADINIQLLLAVPTLGVECNNLALLGALFK